jgi:tetratricopeptide (TPR) repeat protein
MTPAHPPAVVDPPPATRLRRYPGVRSFEEHEAAHFFGRHQASQELLLRVLSVRLLLQFAPSGAGKTSLLQAGLFPKLRHHGYFPCTVRLNEEHESLSQAVARSLRDSAREHALEDPVVPDGSDTLWTLLAGTQLWTDDLRLLTPVLVFDQFEEIFTRRDEQFRKRFAQEVGELSRAHGRQEESVEHREPPPPVKFIISLREEYLGKLEEMSAAIPELFHERLRLLPLSHDEAREAIVEPARLDGDWFSPRFEFDPACLEALIDFIDGASLRVRVVEPLTLQLVCQRAEDIAVARAESSANVTLTLDDFGGASGLENLVLGYYTDQLKRLPRLAARKRVQTMFERGLLDPHGKRLMLEEEEIARDYGVAPEVLNALVDSRLLRREPRNESVFYEISHDRLTEVIAKHRPIKLPGWVIPTLGVAAMFIAVLGLALYYSVKARNDADAAKTETATALQRLFGDDLTLRLREAGLSDVFASVGVQFDSLQQVLNRAASSDIHDPLASALQLRRLGELAWERDTLRAAEEKFVEALGIVDAAIAGGAQDRGLHVERAQLLKWTGDVLRDKGQIAEARARYAEAVAVWDQVTDSNASPEDILNSAEAQVALGLNVERLGDVDRAETHYVDAAFQVLPVLRASYERSQDGRSDDGFELGRALQVYADAGLSLARVWLGVDDMRGARALAVELLRLRPLSAQARVQLGTASAMYGIAVINTSPQTAHRLFDESRRQFQELTQFDRRNRRMVRELAAVQLLTAEGVSQCATVPECRKALGPRDLESAEIAALESLGIFRQLADHDRENRSLQDDIAWGLETQAKVMGARGDSSKALRLVDDALKIRLAATADNSDVVWLGSGALTLQTKAKLLSDVGRHAAASQAVEEAFAAIEQLPAGLIRTLRRIEAMDTRMVVLNVARRPADARKVDVERAAMLKQIGEPWTARRARALRNNRDGISHYQAATKSSGAAAAGEFERAAGSFAAATKDEPFDAIMWDNHRSACARTAERLEPQAETSKTASASNQREVALRCAFTSAWMAWILSNEIGASAGSAGDVNRLRTLYEDRRTLAMALRDEAGRVSEALRLAEQGVKDAAAYVQQNSSPDAMFYVADAHYGLGLMRHTSGADGWEQSMRAAIRYGEQWRDQQRRDAERHRWLGTVHAELAKALDAANRGTEATVEWIEAESVCGEALRVASNDAGRQSARACLESVKR